MLRSLRKKEYNQVKIDHLFQSLVLRLYLLFRMVYRCMQPPCLNLILCTSSFADVVNAVIYPMLQIYTICLKKQTGQSPRRLVAYLLIRCIICRPELKNLQNVWELKQTYYPVLTRNALKLQPRTKLLRQFHLFSNFCALLPSPLNTKSKPPPHPLFKVALV